MLIAHEISGKEHPIRFVIIGNGLGFAFQGGLFIILFIAVITSTWLFEFGRTLYEKAGAVLRGSTASF